MKVKISNTNIKTPNYRPDIDGLRALAIIAVVIFHAFPIYFPHGYLGVDIFFVISGYLITSIIYEKLRTENFSILQFYGQRIRRLFPALIIVLIIVLLVGWNSLYPNELRHLGRHVFSSMGFFQNIMLWRENKYFDPVSEKKPLLHLWSLSVEEQYYLMLPICLFLIFKFVKKEKLKNWLLIFSLTVFSISFFFYIKDSTLDTNIFYLSPYRFYQISIGAIGALLNFNFTKLKANIFSILGIILMIGCFFYDSFDFIEKNYLLLILSLATVITISAGKEAILNKYILSNKMLVWIGLISYPLYLWHWPILSFARIFYGETLTNTFKILATTVSLILAWLTMKFIEYPIRFNPKHRVLKTIMLIFILALLGGSGFLLDLEYGLHDRRFVEKNPLETTAEDDGDLGFFEQGCGINDNEIENKFAFCVHDKRKNPTIALLGDSKAFAISSGLVRNSSEDQSLIVMAGTGEFGSPNPYHWPGKNNDDDKNPLVVHAIQAIVNNQSIKTVIIYFATRTMFELNNDYSITDLVERTNEDFVYEKTIEMLKPLIAAKKKIIFILDHPTFNYPEDCLQRFFGISVIDNWVKNKKSKNICSISIDEHLKLSQKYRDTLIRIQSYDPKAISLFDTLPHVCDTKTKVCSLVLNDRQIYKNTDHLSDYGSGLIGKPLMEIIR